MHKYRELKVWQRGIQFAVMIYHETAHWPNEERFGLINQARRAAYSIPMNIAEGAGNDSTKEFCRFLEMALRSGYEVETAIEIALGLGFIADEKARVLQKEADEIIAMIVGLMKSLGWKSKIAQ